MNEIMTKKQEDYIISLLFNEEQNFKMKRKSDSALDIVSSEAFDVVSREFKENLSVITKRDASQMINAIKSLAFSTINFVEKALDLNFLPEVKSYKRWLEAHEITSDNLCLLPRIDKDTWVTEVGLYVELRPGTGLGKHQN